MSNNDSYTENKEKKTLRKMLLRLLGTLRIIHMFSNNYTSVMT